MGNRDFFLQQCASEHPRFLGVLEAAPADQLDFRPHPRSRSARELIGHLIGHELDLVELAETGSINHRMQVPFETLDEALSLYRGAHEALAPTLARLDDNSWGAMGQFLAEGALVYEAPRCDLAWMLLFDAIHHRGQLSSYLRPMGGKVPSIYGPSADTVLAPA